MVEAGFVCRCPTCEMTFRVSETQLAAAHGAVRCGACLQVFAANDYLQETALSASEAEVISERASAAINDVAEQADNQTSVSSGWDEGQTESLQVDQAISPLEPKSSESENSVSQAPRYQAEIVSVSGPYGARPDEQLKVLKRDDRNTEPTTGVSPDQEAEKNTEVEIDVTNADLAVPEVVTVFLDDRSNKTLAVGGTFGAGPELGEKSDPRRDRIPDFNADAEVHALDKSSPLGEPDKEPSTLEDVPEIQLEAVAADEIVGEYQDTARSHFLRWFVGALLLGLVFVIQFASVNVELLAQDPKLRPYYAFFCNYVECNLPVFEDVSAIETTELVVRVHPETERALLVDAIIRNTSAYRQSFPLLEMKFTDINNLVIATRRFLPKEYLGGEMVGLRFIPALTEVRLGLEIVDPGENAFGYALEAVPAI